MNRALSETETSRLMQNGIEVTEHLGSGTSSEVFAIAPYKGVDNLCIKYYYDYPHKTIQKEYERYRLLYNTAPTQFARVYDLVWIDFPDEQVPDLKHHAAAMVMERLKPLDVTDRSLNNMVKVLFDCLACLGYIHILAMVHRDLKADNIMYCERTGTYVLLDYGISHACKGTFTEPNCTGTFYYISPESLRGCYSKKSDLYSMGMIIREMLVGREYDIPEDGDIKEVIDSLYHIKSELKPLDESKFNSPQLIRIVNRLTRFDREERYPDYKSAILDVKKLIQQNQKVHLSKQVCPAGVICLIAVNELYLAGMDLNEVLEVTRESIGVRSDNSLRVSVFPFSDKLYLTPRQNSQAEFFSANKKDGFLNSLREQIKHIRSAYREYNFNPDIKLCVVGASNTKRKRRGIFRKKRTASQIYETSQMTVGGDAVVDFGSMGIENVIILNRAEALRQYLFERFSSSCVNQ